MPRVFGTDGVRGLANGRRSPPSWPWTFGRRRPRAHRPRRLRPEPRAPAGRRRPRPADLGAVPRARGRGRARLGRRRRAPARGAADAGRRLPHRRPRRRPRRGALSASHNPMPDNGIKFLARGGRQARRRRRGRRSRSCSASDWDRPTGAAVGRVRPLRAAGRGVRRPPASPRSAGRLDGLKVVVDCANGAASEAAPIARCAPPAPRWSHRCRARRPQHQRRLRLHPPGAAAGVPSSSTAPTPASPSTATPTAAWPSTTRATSSTATRSWRSSRSRSPRAGAARRRHRRGHRDEQPRLRAGDGGRRHQRGPDAGRRPLRARGDARRRATRSAASSPAM